MSDESGSGSASSDGWRRSPLQSGWPTICPSPSIWRRPQAGLPRLQSCSWEQVTPEETLIHRLCGQIAALSAVRRFAHRFVAARCVGLAPRPAHSFFSAFPDRVRSFRRRCWIPNLCGTSRSKRLLIFADRADGGGQSISPGHP